MILIDTSAWIEFLRDTGSPACRRVDELLGTGFATCHPVRMEVLAGARDDVHLSALRSLLARGELVATNDMHFEAAAAIYRSCRRNGETVRRMIDCLIAALAISADTAVLHADSDFDAIARHTPLRVEPTI